MDRKEWKKAYSEFRWACAVEAGRTDEPTRAEAARAAAILRSVDEHVHRIAWLPADKLADKWLFSRGNPNSVPAFD